VSAGRKIRTLGAQFHLILVCSVCIASAVGALLPVLPIVVRGLTKSTSGAGAVSAAMALGMVALELGTPALIGRVQTGRLIVAGFAVATVAMGGFMLISSLPVMLGLGAVFGAGSGVIAATTTVAVEGLASASARGRAVGLYGAALTAPQIVAPAGALILLSRAGPTAVFLGVAMICMVGILAASRLRLGEVRGEGGVMKSALRRPRLLSVFAAYVLVAATFGGVISYTTVFLGKGELGSAAAFFVLFGATRAVSRIVSGFVLDQVGELWVSLPSFVAAGCGLLLLSRGGSGAVGAGALYGAGFGALQTASLVGMLDRIPQAESRIASSLWNFAIDGGVGMGALGLGAVAGLWGYRTMFATLPLFAVGALLLRAGEGWRSRERGQRESHGGASL
jgi:predicted MFS family arabinose efflux permease